MQINLSKFKKIKDGPSAAILEHPNGHRFVLKKGSLKKEHLDELNSLPTQNYAEGGEVNDGSDILKTSGSDTGSQAAPQQAQAPINLTINTAAPAQPVVQKQSPAGPNDVATSEAVLQDPNVSDAKKNEIRMAMNGAEAQFPEPKPAAQLAQAPSAAELANQMPSSPALSQQAIANDPFGTESTLQNTAVGVEEQMKGQQGLANTIGAQGKQEAEARQNYLAQQQENLEWMKKNRDYVMNEHQSFMSALQKNEIDPQSYIKNMPTGKKVLTGIGLLLSGFGSGLAHQDNMAMGFLNKAIDRDVDAQKQNFQNKESLLKTNLQYLGDMDSASDMLRVQTGEMFANQLASVAAQNASPMAQQKAQIMIGQLRQQNAQLLGQVIARKNMIGPQTQGSPGANASTSAAASEVDPALKIQYLAPEKDREGLMKDLKAAQGMVKQRDNLMDAFDFASGNNTVLNTVGHLGFTPAKTKAAVEPVLAQLVKDSEGRITPQDTDMIRALMPAAGDLDSTIQLKKLQLQKFIDEKLNFPSLRPYQIDPNRWSRYGAQGQKKFKLGPAQ